MREILFRGKAENIGMWVYGWLLKDRSGHIMIQDAENFEWYTDVDPATVGQYAGLQDKNGNKVFEGDILELYDQFVKYRGVVEFRHSAFIIKCGNRMTTLYEIERQNHFNSGLWNLNVIGNIYDNLELLDVK